MSPPRIAVSIFVRVVVALFISEISSAQNPIAEALPPRQIPRLAPVPPQDAETAQTATLTISAVSESEFIRKLPAASGSTTNIPKEILQVAESHEGISFDELQAIARQNNPSLREKYALIAAAQGERLQAGLYPNPVFTSANDNLGVGTGPKIGAGVSQEIVVAKKKKLDRSIANVDVHVAQREYAMESQRLCNQVKIAAYHYLATQFLRHIHEYSKRICTEVLGDAEKNYKAGKAKMTDVHQFRVTLAEANVHYRNAVNDERNAWTQLAAVLGTPDMPQQTVAGTLLEEPPMLDWETSWVCLQRMSPQMQIACLKARQAQVNISRQQAERYANITMNALVSQDMTADATVPFVGISVPLKIYDRNQGNIAKAQAQLAAANRGAEAVRLELYRSLANTFKDFENAKELVKAFETKILHESYEALQETLSIYKSGDATSYIELHHQRLTMIDLSIRFVDALESQLVSAALIEGMLLGTP